MEIIDNDNGLVIGLNLRSGREAVRADVALAAVAYDPDQVIIELDFCCTLVGET